MRAASTRRATRLLVWTRAAALLAATGAGLVGLGLSEACSWEVVGIALVATLVAPLLGPRLSGLPWAIPTLTVVGILGVGGALGSLELHRVVGLGLVYLGVQRLWARTGTSDDRTALLISLLMLILTAVQTSSPLFLALVLLWAAAAPLALLLGHLDRGPRGGLPLNGLVLALPAATLALAIPLFLVLPRWSGSRSASTTSSPVALAGFQDAVELGAVGEILTSREPVFKAWIQTARGQEVPGPLYFRGVILDRFDGVEWSNTSTDREVVPVSPLDAALTRAPARGYRVVVHREPLAENVLFTTGEVVSLSTDDASLERDRHGNWFLRGSPRAIEYVVHSTPPLRPEERPEHAPEPPLSLPLELVPWTELPPALDPRVVDLAHGITAGEPDPWRRVLLLRDHLLGTLHYTHSPGMVDDDDPLASFLFERRSGHCEYFATALAVMARIEGVPSRLVNGFVGGEHNDVGGYWQFRRIHAHSWVEVHLPGFGWLTVDATPGPAVPPRPTTRAEQLGDALRTFWYGGVLDYDLATQAGAVLTAGRRVEQWVWMPPMNGAAAPPWLGLVLLGVALALLVLLIRRVVGRLAVKLAGEERVHATGGRIARLHARARRRLYRRGWRIPPSLPPVAAARWMRARIGARAEPLEELAWLHYRVRYGGEDDGRLLPEAQALLNLLDELAGPE